MLTDPIADMLTRIRNAIMVERQSVDMNVSKLKRGVAEVLKREGFIWDWEEVDDEQDSFAQLRLELKYGTTGEKVIRHIKRISKPGRRIYTKSKDLRPVLNGLGIQIISTSQGVFSDREARQKGIGGEVIAEVW
ncbi:MAG: 30S ribosomal protein S8 [Planctomycetota bacterium]|nr:30S ribosomal protein S8 [Planctomycetota bacterium]